MQDLEGLKLHNRLIFKDEFAKRIQRIIKLYEARSKLYISNTELAELLYNIALGKK